MRGVLASALIWSASAQMRVWSICGGPQFHPPTELEQANGITAGNSMCCTPEYTFEQLCCLDYPNIRAQMTRCGVLGLDAQQHITKAGTIMMENDATNPAEQIAVVCTSPSPVGATAAAHDPEAPSAATVPIECLKREFTIGELTGAKPGSCPGAAVLDVRIEYLMEQQVPAEAIPVCREQVQCPGGKAPASASPEYLAARAAAMNPAAQAPAAQAPGAQAPAAQAPAVQAPGAQAPAAQAPVAQAPLAQTPAGGSQPVVLAKEAAWLRAGRAAFDAQARSARSEGFGGTFGGALLTSGSFTMMAASGGFFAEAAPMPQPEPRSLLRARRAP